MDNYTKFPNDIMEAALGRRFSAIQLTVIMYVVRKVNGWGKPSDAVSVSRMAAKTGYTRRAMINAVRDLEEMGVLAVERIGSGRLSEMRVNNPENWKQPVNGGSHVNSGSLGTAVHRGVNGGSQGGVNVRSQEPVNGGSHTKEKKEIYKDTYKKKEASPPLPEDDEEDEPYPDDYWEDP